MNLIECQYQQTKYWSFEHPCIFIDGQRLDILVDSLSKNHDTAELIPTLFSALDEQNGSKVVWDRVLPDNGLESILPILMCPDDLDLNCTVIVTRVTNHMETISWDGFGLNQSIGDDNNVGSEVIWFSNTRFNFSKDSYLKMLNLFKKEQQNDETQ